MKKFFNAVVFCAQMMSGSAFAAEIKKPEMVSLLELAGYQNADLVGEFLTNAVNYYDDGNDTYHIAYRKNTVTPDTLNNRITRMNRLNGNFVFRLDGNKIFISSRIEPRVERNFEEMQERESESLAPEKGHPVEIKRPEMIRRLELAGYQDADLVNRLLVNSGCYHDKGDGKYRIVYRKNKFSPSDLSECVNEMNHLNGGFVFKNKNNQMIITPRSEEIPEPESDDFPLEIAPKSREIKRPEMIRRLELAGYQDGDLMRDFLRNAITYYDIGDNRYRVVYRKNTLLPSDLDNRIAEMNRLDGNLVFQSYGNRILIFPRAQKDFKKVQEIGPEDLPPKNADLFDEILEE